MLAYTEYPGSGRVLARAEVLLVEGAAKVHTRNVIEFKKYRKFEAEVKISTE